MPTLTLELFLKEKILLSLSKQPTKLGTTVEESWDGGQNW